MNQEYFFCTYGDALSNIDIIHQLKFFNKSPAHFLLSAAKLRSRFGEVIFDSETKILRNFLEKPLMQNLVNIGYFIFNRRIFDYCIANEMLESSAMQLLVQNLDCVVYEHSGFWQPIDTLRELTEINRMMAAGEKPWEMK
jgi:glucose-1-phosphate cytidylyltransferase